MAVVVETAAKSGHAPILAAAIEGLKGNLGSAASWIYRGIDDDRAPPAA